MQDNKKVKGIFVFFQQLFTFSKCSVSLKVTAILRILHFATAINQNDQN
jgi:hypothetical protein